MTTITLALGAESRMVSALTAPKRASYLCLECGAPMHVRRGEERAAHFAHDHEGGRCTGESVTHLAAKRLLRLQVEAELAEQERVQWVQRCAGATETCRFHAVLPQEQALIGPLEVREEVTHGRYRFDVAVVAPAGVVFGFEVYYRHLVPEQKAADLDVPWLELVAEDILEFKPRVPYRGSLSEQRCTDCEALYRGLQEREQRDQVREAQSSKYILEVIQVRQTWAEIMTTARSTDARQRLRRNRR